MQTSLGSPYRWEDDIQKQVNFGSSCYGKIKVTALVKKHFILKKKYKNYLLIFYMISFSRFYICSDWGHCGRGPISWGYSGCSGCSCCGCSGSSQGWKTFDSTGLCSITFNATGFHFSNIDHEVLMVEPFGFIKIAIVNDKWWKNGNDQESS